MLIIISVFNVCMFILVIVLLSDLSVVELGLCIVSYLLMCWFVSCRVGLWVLGVIVWFRFSNVGMSC